MKPEQKCQCERPILRERSQRKGVSESYCGRCERPLSLQLAAVKPAA
jgi:predicted SprT family Zn-dependent metalloprotease